MPDDEPPAWNPFANGYGLIYWLYLQNADDGEWPTRRALSAEEIAREQQQSRGHEAD